MAEYLCRSFADSKILEASRNGKVQDSVSARMIPQMYGLLSGHAEAQEKDGIAVPHREISLQVARRVALLYEVPPLGEVF